MADYICSSLAFISVLCCLLDAAKLLQPYIVLIAPPSCVGRI